MTSDAPRNETILWLVRHGDRQDFLEGQSEKDPHLSALGQAQAAETAEEILRQGRPDQVLASPFRRVIQTASPLAEKLNLEVCIDEGLAEIFYHPGMVPLATDRKQEMNVVSDSYSSLLSVKSPEDFPTDYFKRALKFAPLLESFVAGRQVVCFSHAACVALVAALLRLPELDATGPLAACGIFRLHKSGDGPWCLTARSGTRPAHLTSQGATRPWDFGKRCHLPDLKCLEVWRQLTLELPFDGKAHRICPEGPVFFRQKALGLTCSCDPLPNASFRLVQLSRTPDATNTLEKAVSDPGLWELVWFKESGAYGIRHFMLDEWLYTTADKSPNGAAHAATWVAKPPSSTPASTPPEFSNMLWEIIPIADGAYAARNVHLGGWLCKGIAESQSDVLPVLVIERDCHPSPSDTEQIWEITQAVNTCGA